jgi:hypothetical protein
LTSSSGTALTGLAECIEPLPVLPNIGASQINDKVEQRDRFGENCGDVLSTLGRDLSNRASVSASISRVRRTRFMKQR